MARVKHALRPVPQKEDTKLPKATFPSQGKYRQCKECGQTVLKGNLARHIRKKHASRVPEGEAVPKLKIRLPSVLKGLVRQRGESGEESAREADEESCTVPINEAHLPPTPESDEEMMHQLARLYSGRVSKPVATSKLGYEKTKILLSIVRDSACRAEVKEVLSQAGLLLHTQEEVDALVRDAEERGRREAEWQVPESTGEDAATAYEEPSLPCESALVPEGHPEDQRESSTSPSCQSEESTTSPREVPPLYVTSCYSGVGQQTIVIHTGGQFGIKVTLCHVSS